MKALYKEAWRTLSELRADPSLNLDKVGTPVLAFGDWATARVVTAGLNPSEDEFRDKDKVPLSKGAQRFVHWSDDALSPRHIDSALHKMRNYFQDGRSYSWFDAYAPFLDELGVSFARGSACHTDYLSPFATSSGIGALPERQKRRLREVGRRYWASVLELCPKLELIVGHGQGWRYVPEWLEMAGAVWEERPLPFQKRVGSSKPPLALMGRTTITGRSVPVVWWKPNAFGNPLDLLSHGEKRELARAVKSSGVTLSVT